MRIIVAILYTESWKDIAAITCANAKKYCDKHGYEFEAIEYPEPYPSDFGFQKLELAKEIFKHNEADLFWSMDCDTVITNHKIKIEDFISDSQDLFICKDYNGYNAGSFVIKNTEFGKYLVDYLLEQKGKPGMHCEQNAIEKYAEEFGEENICVLKHPAINSYLYENYPDIPAQTHEQGQWQEGDFVLHLPGVGIEKRLNILRNTKITE